MLLMALWMLRPRTTPESLDHAPPPPGLDREVLRKIFAVGIPIGLQFSAEVGIFSLVTLLMGRLGGQATAAHQIALGLTSFSFMGALGIAQATSVRVGMFVGRRGTPEARRAGGAGIVLGVATMAVWSMIFALAPALLARIFTPDAAVIASAVPLVRIGALFQLADGAQVVSAGALRGIADTRFPLVANVVTHWLVGFPVGWLLAFELGLGARGLWFGLTAGLALVSVSLIARFVWRTRHDVAAL
jgi:MATE family multidrug resistance protein